MVYHLEGIDQITPPAANRLLKTLEEPPESTFAILTAEAERRVMSTILSRCFVYRLGSGSTAWDDPIPAHLLGDETPDELENLVFAGLLEPVIQWTKVLLKGGLGPLKLASQLKKATDPQDMSDVLYVLSVWLRDLVHTSLGQGDFIIFSHHKAELETQAGLANVPALIQAVGIVVDTRQRIAAHVAGQLNLEQMCIRIQEVLRSV